ncbi:MAG: TfoX/Sxy family protein [Clostridia bacterium]|nr:TfoX/Sxy family protein [Clostridia bacterium]
MATGKQYISYLSEQLSSLDGIVFRPMMGEYLLYFRGRLAGGVYDERLLIKPVPSAREYIPSAEDAIPYDGAKPMLLVDNTDDKEFLCGLFIAIYNDLPEPKTKKKNG